MSPPPPSPTRIHDLAEHHPAKRARYGVDLDNEEPFIPVIKGASDLALHYFSLKHGLSSKARTELLHILKSENFSLQDLPANHFLNPRTSKTRELLHHRNQLDIDNLSTFLPFSCAKIKHPTILPDREFLFYYRNPVQSAFYLFDRFPTLFQGVQRLLFGQKAFTPDGTRIFGEANTADAWVHMQAEVGGIDTVLLPCRYSGLLIISDRC